MLSEGVPSRDLAPCFTLSRVGVGCLRVCRVYVHARLNVFGITFVLD